MCDSNVSTMRAIFEPIEYTCASGTFLPANTAGCRPCPSGYTCSGGTYAFDDKKSQGAVRTAGLTTQNISNSCAINASRKMVAVYEPKTVTLNFDDDNGNTTTTTCTYDGLINVPETPTRVGYSFAGWRLEVNNE